MQVYISGALQASRDLAGARALYEAAATAVARAGHEPYLPHQHTDPVAAAGLNPAAVFRRDMQFLRDSDAVVAFLNEPSLGVGAEMVLACEAGIPVLALHRFDIGVSRFVIGYLDYQGATVASYHDLGEMETAVSTFLAARATPLLKQAC